MGEGETLQSVSSLYARVSGKVVESLTIQVEIRQDSAGEVKREAVNVERANTAGIKVFTLAVDRSRLLVDQEVQRHSRRP